MYRICNILLICIEPAIKASVKVDLHQHVPRPADLGVTLAVGLDELTQRYGRVKTVSSNDSRPKAGFDGYCV